MPPIEATIIIEPDGSAHIDEPTGLPVGRHRVLLHLTEEHDATDPNGWPIGFLDQTYGSLADDPLPEVSFEPSQEREDLA